MLNVLYYFTNLDHRPYEKSFYAVRSRFKCYKDVDIGVNIIKSNKSKLKNINLEAEIYDFGILRKENEKQSKVEIYNRKKLADLYNAENIDK